MGLKKLFSEKKNNKKYTTLKKLEGDASAKSVNEQCASFRSVYESRDGALCVFEDKQGHLIAVQSSKLV